MFLLASVILFGRGQKQSLSRGEVSLNETSWTETPPGQSPSPQTENPLDRDSPTQRPSG